jgi:hypothetical protein
MHSFRIVGLRASIRHTELYREVSFEVVLCSTMRQISGWTGVQVNWEFVQKRGPVRSLRRYSWWPTFKPSMDFDTSFSGAPDSEAWQSGRTLVQSNSLCTLTFGASSSRSFHYSNLRPHGQRSRGPSQSVMIQAEPDMDDYKSRDLC